MIHWTNIVFTVITLILLYKTLKDFRKNFTDLGFIENAFWGALLLIFVIFWGGLFWW